MAESAVDQSALDRAQVFLDAFHATIAGTEPVLYGREFRVGGFVVSGEVRDAAVDRFHSVPYRFPAVRFQLADHRRCDTAEPAVPQHSDGGDDGGADPAAYQSFNGFHRGGG